MKSILANDPLTQLAFSVYENKGVFAVFLGSGISRAAEIPTGWDITLDLIRRVALAQGVENQPNWADWYRERTGEEPNYSVLLEELAASPDERRSILHSYIEPTAEDREEGRKVPTAAHKAIASLVRGGYIRVIITTNFDRLMENALRECGVEPTVVASVDALAGAEPITHSACYILKIHGDYKDARILNTEQELSDYPFHYNTLLNRIFDEHGLIVCGWSGEWDYALRAAFMRVPNRRYSVFWAARGNIGTGAQDLVTHRCARIISIKDADSFFRALQQRVETLEQSHRQNPLSIQLLVNSAKRFLAKPEYRIQLDELFTQETERVIAQLDSPKFAIPPQWDEGVFRTRVRQYEAATEALASMAGVLGRWGDDSKLPLVLDVIFGLYAHANTPVSGHQVFCNIRSYPAVLVFTAYGLGLTRGEKWGALHVLFDSAIRQKHRDSIRIINALFINSWVGGEKDIWQQIEGLERHKTPLSDHLFALFLEWGKAFFGLMTDFELTFGRFEILGALAYLEINGKETVQQSHTDNLYNGWTWMPLGRVGWNTSNSTSILSDIQSEPMKSRLIRDGFANRDAEFIDIFIENFRRMAKRMQWE